MDWVIPHQKSKECQELLQTSPCTHCGWLRKRSTRNIGPLKKLFCWPQVYVVLSGGCMYYYRNERSGLPAGSFSLYSYNTVMRAGEIIIQEAPWAFKIIHTIDGMKKYYFTASSEQEMKEWMKHIKQELMRANNKRTDADGGSDDGSAAYDDFEKIESKIYDDPSELKIPRYFNVKKEDDSSDEDIDSFPLASGGIKGKRPLPPPPLVVTPSKLCMEELNRKIKQVSLTDVVLPERIRPVGESKKKKFTEASPNPTKNKPLTSPSCKPSEDITGEDYWKAMYFNDGDKTKSSEIIRNIGEDGVYLVRGGMAGPVLVVFWENVPRKFQIYCVDNNYYIVKDKQFEAIENLLYYYYTHNIPGQMKVKLSMPYKIHKKYMP